jgi:hypothetical protein
MATRQATTDVSSQLVPPLGILCVIVDLLFTFLFFMPWLALRRLPVVLTPLSHQPDQFQDYFMVDHNEGVWHCLCSGGGGGGPLASSSGGLATYCDIATTARLRRLPNFLLWEELKWY